MSALVVANFLEDELKSKTEKHCDTCSCAKKHLAEVEGIQMIFNIGTQTDLSTSNCLRCNSVTSNPNSPYLVKLKSSDSVISTKSSISDKSFTPSKVEDLKVNPMLGHHRLCEHTKNFNCLSKTDEIIPASKNSSDPTEKKNVRNGENLGDVKSPQKQQKLSHGAGNGSNNSLWSKTSSSKEGAKLFENFNRNLIKAIGKVGGTLTQKITFNIVNYESLKGGKSKESYTTNLCFEILRGRQQ